MNAFPKILLLFMAVDWPIYMRRPMVYALAEAARRFNCRVVAVNRPLCPISTAFTKPHRLSELVHPAGLTTMADNLYLFSPTYCLYDGLANRFAPIESLNLAVLRASYRGLEKKLGVSEEAPVIWFNHPQQGYVMKLFRDSYCIFELYDNLADNTGNTSESLKRLERRMRRRADLLLTTSRRIHDAYGANYKNALMFGNGLSQASYERLSDEGGKASDRITIPGPRIGYAGMVSERLDWGLITGLAKRRPEWQFIFAGRVNDSHIPTRCAAFSNIHFPGEFAYEEVPSVLRSFDVGILPYLDNTFFHFLNPLKFYEFAAAGLATVSSNVDELRQYPTGLVEVLDNVPDLWVEAIERKLGRDREECRRIGREVAGRYIWEDMTAKLLQRISEEMM